MKIQNVNIRTVEIISALFIFIFVYTSISKVLDYTSFKTVLSKSPLIGNSADLTAWMLPVVELVISLCLFFPRTRGLGLKLTLGLMTLFTIYVLYMLLFVPDLPCSCGGVISAMSWTQHLFFNIALTIIALIGILKLNTLKLFIAIDRNSRTPV
jgi:hypothetical protein